MRISDWSSDVCSSDLPDLAGWNGFGLAVQAYQKRALPLLDWLADMAKRHKRRLMVRLVKGAYWDSEVKLAQELGLDGYPVFTRKAATDLSYLACAKRLRSEEHTSELQSLMRISYAVFCLQKKTPTNMPYT